MADTAPAVVPQVAAPVAAAAPAAAAPVAAAATAAAVPAVLTTPAAGANAGDKRLRDDAEGGAEPKRLATGGGE
jgi:hypothetical protein